MFVFFVLFFEQILFTHSFIPKTVFWKMWAK